MNYKGLVLGGLLDRYEKSRHFMEGNSQRRVLLNLAKGDLPEYDIESPLIRETFNSVVDELAGKGLISFEWLKYEEGNIIEKVWLNTSRVEDCYTEISRKAKRTVLDTLLKRVINLKETTKGSWMALFMADVERSIYEKASTAGLLPADEEQAMAILDALDYLGRLEDGQCLERVFSLRCFGDSKYFEKKVKNRLVSIIKKYCIKLDFQEDLSDDEVLMQVGIMQSPDQVDFKGGICGMVSGKRIDFSVFIHGISLNADTIRDLTIEGMGCVRRILFIENKANYLHFLAANKDDAWMAVFLGGFYSPAKGAFFKKLYEAACPNGIQFFHWGDMDLGGFLIYKRLKTNIIPSLKPFLMHKEAFESRMAYGVAFDSRYASKLRALQDDALLPEFKDLIKLMLDKGLRIEQEAFLKEFPSSHFLDIAR